MRDTANAINAQSCMNPMPDIIASNAQPCMNSMPDLIEDLQKDKNNIFSSAAASNFSESPSATHRLSRASSESSLHKNNTKNLVLSNPLKKLPDCIEQDKKTYVLRERSPATFSCEKILQGIKHDKIQLIAIKDALSPLNEGGIKGCAKLTVIDDVIKSKSELNMLSRFKNWFLTLFNFRKPDSERVISKINEFIQKKNFVYADALSLATENKGKTIQDLNDYIEKIKSDIETMHCDIEFHSLSYGSWKEKRDENIEIADKMIKRRRGEFEKLKEFLNKKHENDKSFSEEMLVKTPINNEIILENCSDKEELSLRFGILFSRFDHFMDKNKKRNKAFFKKDFMKNMVNAIQEMRKVGKEIADMPYKDFKKRFITYQITLEEMKYLVNVVSDISEKSLPTPPIKDEIKGLHENEGVCPQEAIKSSEELKNMRAISARMDEFFNQ